MKASALAGYICCCFIGAQAWGADNPMKYFRAEDAVAYSNCVHSITNVQQGGELYGMTWAAEADYHLDRAVAASRADGMSLMHFLCTNVLDNAPQPTIAGFPGCTAFMVTNTAGEHLVGRNLDYMLPMAHVLLFVPKNPSLNRKYSSIGSVDAGWVGYDAGHLDDDKTDLSYAALFPYYCMDGMNEKGVMVTILALDARTRPSTGVQDWMTEQFHADRPNVVLNLALRYLLDNAGTAEECVRLMENFNVFAAIGGNLGIAGNYHLYICDPSGDTRTIEWMPPENEGESWRLCEVKGSKAISNFHLTDGYGHGSNRWEIARHAIACCDGHLESPDAMNLCRAVAQRKGADLTSTTHWSILYNLDALSADIATFCHYEEIFPYGFKEGNDAWEIGAAKSVKPSVETDLPAYDAKTAEAGKVYRTTASNVESEPEWRPSVTGACVSAVNRMGCTYETAGEPIHVVVKVDGATKMLFYADYTGAVNSFLCEHIVAGMSAKGVSAHVARFRTSGAAGGVPASKAVFTALSNPESTSAVAAAGTLSGSLPELPGTGVIFTDAKGNVAVWPAGSELVTDDASEMVKYSLDLRQGIYEVDGEGRGQFDELPGLMRLAASADTKAIVSMGYGHLDVMLPNSNVLWRTELEGVTIPAYGVIAEPKAVAHARGTVTYADGSALEVNNQNRRVAETNALLKVEYKTENDFYFFPDGTHTWTCTFRAAETLTMPPAPGAAQLRKPDYAAADGKDWLYNHAIAGKACPDEAAADSGVDLFYVYPTLVGNEQIVIDGFRGIDDPAMRDLATNMTTAVGSYCNTARCFADMMQVYAPFYRQATLDTATDCATNVQGEVVADANAKYLAKLCEGPAYSDVTNALTTYFAKWNNGRKFMLAAHSQGSAILRLVMENYFTLPENQDKAKRLVCSYQIGFGIGQSSVDAISAATGVTFAEMAEDTNVIVSYNSMGEGSSGNSVLLPPDTLAINPLSWSRSADHADKDLNLGALTSDMGTPDVIAPHLYGAQIVDTGANRGQVNVCKELNGQVLPPNLFGTGSLHAYDYCAYWEDLHKNCYDRIAAATGKAPVVGKPSDYSNTANWLRYGDKDNAGSTAKPFDIFYLYPTSTGSSEYVAPVDDDMKERALGNYRQSVEPLESYANVYAPYYRQISATGIMSDPTVEGLQLNLARHVGKTDVFAALDYYFTNVNVNAKRPFVLASHSQGSASLKNAFEQYFVGEKKAYLEKMIAAYTVGYTFSTDWCAKYGVTFATGAADTGVLMTWNAEGPGAPALANMLTKDPHGQAINPLNWKRDETYAPVSENLGSFRDGELVAGVTDALLQPSSRPGALVVSNATGYAYAPAALFGQESYHFDDWGMFRENACANILVRGKDLTGYCKLCTTNFPKHLCVSEAEVEPQEASTSLVKPVGGTVWIRANGLSMATVYLAPEKGYRLLREGSEVSGVAVSLYPQNLKENGEFLIPADQLSGLKVEWIQRAPDYADATGKDWLFRHDIAAKRYEGEPSQDPGVDLFYFYPTSVNVCDDHAVDGICDIDDEYLRSDKGALSSWNMTAKVFGDFTHVYAPYYRQTPVDVEMTFPQDGTGYDKITQYWYARAPYADVTNALTRYFTQINPNGERPFVLAGHSHGAGMLILAMEHFFKDHPQWLGNMVACYAIGMGVSDKWEASVKGYAPIATNATDAGVYVFWNTEGPGTSEGMISGLWPTNHVAGVNPITWTRTGEYAPASLNLGGWTADDSGAVRPGLYDASNNVAHGTLVCSSPDLVARYMDPSWGFGEKSLHGWDYKIYWENIRANALQRIKTMKVNLGEPDYAQIPLAGTPIDYGDRYNWVTNTGTTKPVDVFYVYPTMMLEGDSTIVSVTDAMKTKAYANAYVDSASAFAGYANVLIPAYRQVHGGAVGVAQTLYPEPRDFVDFYKGQTSRTDLFAALDYYFTNINAGVQRPFILAGHSQGSCMLKIAFEDYFRSSDTRKGYLAKMVAAYPLGYSFSQDWFDRYYSNKELTFATNATDKAALISWNTEGPNATKRSFVIENGALVINPMNWTTNANEWAGTTELSGMIQQRTATDFDYGDNTYALVTTNATDYLPISSGFGEKSLHGYDWKLWYEQIKENGFVRFATFAGFKEVSDDNIPTVADTTWKIEMSSDGKTWAEAIKSPAGTYYVDGTSETRKARVTYTVSPEKAAANFIFPHGKTTVTFPMAYDKGEGKWVQPQDVADILAATKVIYNQRKPDYTKAKDWLLNHVLKPDEAKSVAGEPSQDPGVDLIYVYGTIAMTNAETTVDGFADLDDPQMRGEEATHTGGAWGMIPGSVKAFSDYTRVYIPFYRQMTLCGATNVMAQVGMEGANKAFADALHEGVAYEDVAAALDAYFANWNEGRPFILAGCSQGAAMLRNMVQHYFTASEKNKDKLDQLVACYGIAYGVTKDWAEIVEAETEGKIHFATNATERGVYISWNTVGPDSTAIPNGLVPPGAISINPLTWTTEAMPAAADKNYGSLTNAATGAIAAHLYDATVDTVKGVVVSTNLPASDYVKGLVWFGDKSLHTWEMPAWWENIRDNAYARIETATGKRPRCGTPNDYSKDENWMVKPETADKEVDVFFLYPTTDVGLTPNLIAPIDDAMKATAWDAYQQNTMGFWNYANMYAPYYRQASFLGLQAQSGVSGLKNFCSTHVVKTDVFAALDYYFTNLNVSAKRPYILVGHSQGSCNIKLIFEEYMKDHADYKAKLVAAYAMGFAVEKTWCEKAGIDFAEGESDTGVILTWNSEGPDATHGPVNFLTEPDDGQAINPLNWKTDGTYADIGLNLGSVVKNAKGEYVWGQGNADAQLSPKAGSPYGFRPGALVVTNTTAEYSPAVLGYQSYHGEDGAFFQCNVGANGLNRYAALTDQAYVDPYDFRVEHASFVVQTVGSDVLNGPAGAAVVEKGAQAFAVYTAEEGYLFGAKDSTAMVALDTSVSPVRPAAGAVLPVARSASLRFERSSYEVLEGGALKVRVCRGEVEEAAQATLSCVRNTGSYSGAYMDGKKVSFPLTLSWSKDDYEPKEIVFQTTASAKAEANKTFTLQLSAKVGEVEFLKLEACTVTIVDAQGGGEETPYVRALAWPANAGTVSGAGMLATDKAYRTLSASAKSYATFAGWYKAKADDPGQIDLAAPVEPYSVRYPRQIRVGYGTDNAAGTYFAYFTNVLAVAAVVEPKAFDDLTGDPLPGVAGVVSQDAASGLYETMVGVKFALPVDYLDDSGKGKLSVTKLPSGLTYNAKKERIEGVPTKAGFFETTFVASNAAGKHTVTYAFVVDEMPALAVGTFAGTVSDDAAGGPHRTGVGVVSFTAGKTGALSAKVTRRQSGTRSFSVKGYDYIDEDTLGIAMTNGYGEVFEATLALTDGWYDTTLRGTAFGGTKRGTLGYNDEEDGVFVAVRNAFTTSDGVADAQQVLAAFKGTYAETLYATNDVGEAEEEVGTVQYRVNAQGSVYVAAKLAATYDGEKKVAGRTLSGTVAGAFVYDETTGLGGCGAALRSSTYLWSTEVLLDYATRGVQGAARYIRPNAEDAAEVVDEDEIVGAAEEEDSDKVIPGWS